MLVRSNDRKKFGNLNIFHYLIQELNSLSTQGIEVICNNIKHTVKFELALIIGDNLGLNQILGFVESFKASSYCRICKLTLKEASTSTRQNSQKMRNMQNYDEDLDNKDLENNGLKEKCVFNRVNNFHVLKNLSVDVTHDLCEGVCMYVIKAIMTYFIFEKKVITLKEINDRIQSFKYDTIDASNKPPIIQMKNLKNNKLNSKMSAAEMLCLV